MKLTIIVPVYKVEPYLHKCIDSILAQTFTDFELILVDDGSPDNCPKICDEYAAKDNRIIVIHKENGGLSSARNAGLDIAKGEYIGFVDSDDWIHPQMYEKMVAIAEYGYDLTVCNIIIHNAIDGKEVIRKAVQEDFIFHNNEIIEKYFDEIREIIFTSAWNKIYKKHIFYTLRYPEGRIYEDESIILDVLSNCENIYFSHEAYYTYVIKRTGSILSNGFSVQRFDLLKMAIEQCNFFKKSKDKKQKKIAYGFYLMYYMWNHYAVYCEFPQYKKEFSIYKKYTLRNLANILNVPDICRMKVLIIISMFIFPNFSYKLCRKYFPECLYDFMR